MTTLVQEIEEGHAALSSFYAQRSTYITSGGTPENYEALPNAVAFENLRTYSYDSALKGAGYSVGISNEVIAEYSALTREIDLGIQSKSALYDSIAAECEQEASLYTMSATYNTAIVQGAPTSGPRV